MSLERAIAEAARSVRIAEILVESLTEAQREYDDPSLLLAREAAAAALSLTRDAAQRLRELGA